MRLTPPCSSLCCCDSCSSFLNDIQRDYGNLHRRHRYFLTKSKRIRDLALPKRHSQKFHSKSTSHESIIRKIQMVYLEDGNSPHTRTEQLAFPPASRLLELKKSSPSYEGFCNVRKTLINRMIRNSLLSLYSRLSNKQPPEQHKPKKKLSEAEWEKHSKRIKALSNPKKDELAQPPPRQAKSSSELRRYKKLAKPRIYEETVAKQWHLTNYLKTYMPSKRIIQMAKPKPFEITDANEPYRVKMEALKYRATSRIRELSKPSYQSNKRPETRENPFQTQRGALKAKASKRTMELAEPKDFNDNHIRSDPYKVSPKALKAKITPRLLALSRPKAYVK